MLRIRALPRLARRRQLSAAAFLLALLETGCRRDRKPELHAATTTAAPAEAASRTLIDPLDPDRPIEYDLSRPPAPAGWVTARPGFQYSLSPAERGGVNPCATQQVDAGAFGGWASLGVGRFTAPREGALDPSGHFDLVLHFHGDQPVLRELVRSGQKLVLYTLTVDQTQSYREPFSGTGLFDSIVKEIERSLTERSGTEARASHVALSAWSAGFTAIGAILTQPASSRVDAVVLIDGLHAPRQADRLQADLKPFVEFARLAAAGERFMLVTYSSIDPPDFASTTETAHHLVAALGGRAQAVRRRDALGLDLVELFDRGSLYVRGYAGNQKPDHCAQLALLRDAFTALGRRWKP